LVFYRNSTAWSVYERINLAELRRIALGDHWEGEISIAKNTIRVVTTRKGPVDETMTIVAR
jgi:hypothetical protein